MKRLYGYLAIIPMLLLLSCEQQPDRTLLNIGFAATTGQSETIAVTKSAEGTGILVDTAVIILRDVSIISQGDGSRTLLSNNTFVVDLLKKSSQPVIVAEAEPGVYNGLSAKLVLHQSMNYSIYLSGTYTQDNEYRRFRYIYSDEGDFIVENQNGIVVNELETTNIWVLIDIIALFEGVDFNSAEANGNDLILINSASNRDIAEIIASNFGPASVVEGSDKSSQGDGSSSDADNGDDGSSDDEGEGDSSGKYNDDNDGDKDEAKDKDKNKDKNKDKDKDKNKDKDKDKDDDDEDDDDEDDDD